MPIVNGRPKHLRARADFGVKVVLVMFRKRFRLKAYLDKHCCLGNWTIVIVFTVMILNETMLIYEKLWPTCLFLIICRPIRPHSSRVDLFLGPGESNRDSVLSVSSRCWMISVGWYVHIPINMKRSEQPRNEAWFTKQASLRRAGGRGGAGEVKHATFTQEAAGTKQKLQSL